jgi:TRAP-type C4-dicarboxylate transport system permease small subunit
MMVLMKDWQRDALLAAITGAALAVAAVVVFVEVVSR